MQRLRSVIVLSEVTAISLLQTVKNENLTLSGVVGS
jgi:hypothetical protein